MLNYSDSFLCEKLLWIVIYQLPVDKYVWFVGKYLLYLVFHFFLFGVFNFGDFLHRVGLDPGSKNLNFVEVHWSVCDEDFWIFLSGGTAKGDFLFEQKSLVQERVLERASEFLNDLNEIQIGGISQSEDCVDSQLSKKLLFVGQQFGTDGGPGNFE